MKAQHTPAPWEAHPRNNVEQFPPYIVSNANGEHIGLLFADKTAEANARLIAAAPELLEAIEAALPWLAKANECGAFKDCALPKGGLQAERFMRHVAAKARGQQA